MISCSISYREKTPPFFFQHLLPEKIRKRFFFFVRFLNSSFILSSDKTGFPLQEEEKDFSSAGEIDDDCSLMMLEDDILHELIFVWLDLMFSLD